MTSLVLVGLGGLEPPTSPLSGVRSNHLSYRPDVAAALISDGGASRDRTDDPLLAKQVLSQLSYGPGIRRRGISPPRSLRDDKTAQIAFQRRGQRLVLDRRCLVWAPGSVSPDSKGGDPAAPSDTATLLRLHPSH